MRGGIRPTIAIIYDDLNTKRKFALLKRLIGQLGLEPERLRLEWISAAEGDKLARVIREMVADIKKMGASPLGKMEALVAGDE